MHRRLLLPAALLSFALVAIACGDDDDDGGSSRPTSTTLDSTSSTTSAEGTDDAPDATGAAVIDTDLVASSIAGMRSFYKADIAEDALYEELLVATCDIVAAGHANGTTASDAAQQIVDQVPEGPEGVFQYTPSAILVAQLYLFRDACGAELGYGLSVREALEPLMSEAFVDARGE